MSRLILSRITQSIPMLIVLSLVVFGLQALAPVDPARMALSAGGAGVALDERDVAAKRRELGLDRSLPERYLAWWAATLRLDLGRSFMSGQPVADLIRQRLPASLALAALATAISIGLALPLGVLMALRPGTWLDQLVRIATLLGTALPGFWLALLAIWLFAVTLRWVPALGSFTPQGIILPALVLALQPLGRLTRLVRALMLDVLSAEYIRVARAKGLRPATVLLRHALPNALLPVTTMIGLDIIGLIAEAAVIEWVFAWPGIGRLSVEAALAGDLPVLMAVITMIGGLVVLINLAVDIGAGMLDPRQREPYAHG
ncbi:MAG: ABC transporter permease [Roseiflexaceae bacterium]